MKRLLEFQVEQILADGLSVRLSPAERDALLEVAFLAMLSDGLLRDEEVEAFTGAMRVLCRPDVETEVVRMTIDQLVEQKEWEDTDARLDEVAASLSAGFAREQAYKLGLLMTLSDFESLPIETDFNDRLRRALSLSERDSERLFDEVTCAVSTRFTA